jgi:hypothetical protein
VAQTETATVRGSSVESFISKKIAGTRKEGKREGEYKRKNKERAVHQSHLPTRT